MTKKEIKTRILSNILIFNALRDIKKTGIGI
jgi:hypothetical protein